jgi:hypothetical protein
LRKKKEIEERHFDENSKIHLNNAIEEREEMKRRRKRRKKKKRRKRRKKRIRNSESKIS